ncbi:MAG: HD domain-containing protein [Pseudomonadota bacterium]
MTELNRETIVPFLAEIFEKNANGEYLGERVTIGAHMLQCALLAEQAGAPDDVVAAALLHDVGHFTHEFETDAADQGIDTVHEEAGAKILADWFPRLVIDCVRCHVDAKRYLCAVDPSYYGKLSDASIYSLKLQGGPMSPEEVTEFESNPGLNDIVQVRLWDEMGKDPDLNTPGFMHYAPLLQRVVDRHLDG